MSGKCEGMVALVTGASQGGSGTGLAVRLAAEGAKVGITARSAEEYVISGRVVLELDDGAVVELGPGDTVVQNGTRHVWRNPFDEPCQMVVVLVGASRTRPRT